jgi:hypothetical protein
MLHGLQTKWGVVARRSWLSSPISDTAWPRDIGFLLEVAARVPRYPVAALIRLLLQPTERPDDAPRRLMVMRYVVGCWVDSIDDGLRAIPPSPVDFLHPVHTLLARDRAAPRDLEARLARQERAAPN